MTRRQEIFLHISVAASTVTGAVYAWMKYFMETDDPFSVVNHPWQPAMLHLHVLLVPMLVFGLGWIFSGHIWKKYSSPSKQRRRTGVAMMIVGVPMIATGYLLQVTTNETALKASTVAHWITSILFVLGYLAHQLIASRRR